MDCLPLTKGIQPAPRAILWTSTSEVSAALGALCAVAGITLNSVTEACEVHEAIARSGTGDVLLIDCSLTPAERIGHCTTLLAQATGPICIIHPCQATVQALAPSVRGLLLWLPPDFGVLTALETLRSLTAAVAPSSGPCSSSQPCGEQSTPSDSPLSYREQEVYRLVAAGYADKEIAAHLDLRLGTVKTYVARVKVKLGASRRGELNAAYPLTKRVDGTTCVALRSVTRP